MSWHFFARHQLTHSYQSFICSAKFNDTPSPNAGKNPIGNFGSSRLKGKAPICQIICVKSLAKKFFNIFSKICMFFLFLYTRC